MLNFFSAWEENRNCVKTPFLYFLMQKVRADFLSFWSNSCWLLFLLRLLTLLSGL